MSEYTLPQLPAPAAVDIYEKSAETMNWLRSSIKVGYTTERGPAWWANGAVTKAGEWTQIPDGSHFDGPVPIEEVKKLLDIKLVKGTVFARYIDADGNEQIATDERTQPVINARTGKIFSYPKEGYRIHPYLETLHGFIQQVQYDEEVGVGSVGLLKGGGVAFLQARLPEVFEVAGYGYQPYITAVTSSDKSRATFYGTGALGAVCDNTVDTAVLGALTKFKIKHSRNSVATVQQAREKLGIRLVAVADEIGKGLEALVNLDVTEQEWNAWLDLTVDIPEKDPKSKTGGRAYTMAVNRREKLEDLWRNDPKVQPWQGTGLGVLQAANTYRTWEGIVKGADGGRLERNFTNDVFGLTAKGDLDALEKLAEVKARKLQVA